MQVLEVVTWRPGNAVAMLRMSTKFRPTVSHNDQGVRHLDRTGREEAK